MILLCFVSVHISCFFLSLSLSRLSFILPLYDQKSLSVSLSRLYLNLRPRYSSGIVVVSVCVFVCEREREERGGRERDEDGRVRDHTDIKNKTSCLLRDFLFSQQESFSKIAIAITLQLFH